MSNVSSTLSEGQGTFRGQTSYNEFFSCLIGKSLVEAGKGGQGGGAGVQA